MLNSSVKNTDLNYSKVNHIIEIIKENPNKRKLYIQLAIELTKINRLDHAIKSFNKANQLSEDYITFYNIGSLYYKKNDFKNAILALEKSKHLNNKFYMTFLLTGLCYGRLNNFKAAESNFISVIMNEPENITALTALAILYFNQGRTNDSLEILGRISNTKDNSDSIQKIKSEIFFNSGRISESVKEIKDFKDSSVKFKHFNEYIKSIPVSILTDKYGTIEEKIFRLENHPSKTSGDLISLSLCYLFSGDTDSAIDYLFEAREKIAI
jgi:tetratricopeptide (TPR) repeat protein